MPIDKREIIERKATKKAFGDKINREIVTLLERSESAFKRSEIIDEISKNHPLEERKHIKSYISVLDFGFSKRIEDHTENKEIYYYID